MHDDDELAGSLAGLSRLLSGHRTLEQSLVRVAEFAVRAIPGADGAGLTLLEADRPQTVVATDEFVTAVDDIQYGLGEGPCVSAVAQRRTFTSGNLGGEPQWPRFGPRVARLGVQSALSLPLVVADHVAGALNVYSRERDVFDDRAQQLAEQFAGPAAVAVANAQVLDQARIVAEQLQTRLRSRAVVDQAVGILMSRHGTAAAEAFASLQSMGRRDNVKLNAVAHTIVDEAVRRARARHSAS